VTLLAISTVLISWTPSRSAADLAAQITEINRGVATIPFELRENRIYVPVKINGSAALNFILDSGAGESVINASRAGALGLSVKAAGGPPEPVGSTHHG
jgi:hypothetical protein